MVVTSMSFFACLLLLASSTTVELLDEYPTIRRGKWNYYEVNLRQRPATLEASYYVQSGSRSVRLALMTRGDEARMDSSLPHGVLAVTDPGTQGTLKFRIRRPDDYAIIVDNRGGQRDAVVHVQVSLDFGPPPGPEVTRASPARQLIVIALSFLFFFGVVFYSARRILRAIHR